MNGSYARLWLKHQKCNYKSLLPPQGATNCSKCHCCRGWRRQGRRKRPLPPCGEPSSLLASTQSWDCMWTSCPLSWKAAQSVRMYLALQSKRVPTLCVTLCSDSEHWYLGLGSYFVSKWTLSKSILDNYSKWGCFVVASKMWLFIENKYSFFRQ